MEPTKSDLLDRIKDVSGCLQIRQLDDGVVVGIGLLLYTTALYVGLSLDSWQKRYCYDDHRLALAEYQRLRSGEDEPSGWIARRPQLPMH